MERVTGIGGVFQRAGQAASLRDWYADLDAMLTQLRSAGVEVVDALEGRSTGASDGRSIRKAPGSSSGSLRRAADG
jgi:hypothetical protein